MGSGITFSGFNAIDFNAVLTAVMQQEQQPITRLETQKTTLETQNTVFGTLASKLATLQSAVDDLKGAHSLAALKATSSDTGVGVSTTSGTVAGTYAVVVSELARSQVLASSSTYGSLTDVVATGGSLTLTSASGAPVIVSLTGSTTIEDLAKAINSAAGSPVNASVVQAAPGVYKLVLTGKTTGAANAFSLTSALSGGAGVMFTDTDADGMYGDSAADNVQTATNALFTVNNLAVESSTNTITDAIPGVTLSLKKKDPATTVTIDVTRDGDAARARIQKFVDGYNAVVSFTKDQNTAAIAGKASIARDPLLRSFKGSMREALQGTYASGGSVPSLASMGLGFDREGGLTLDAARFDDAVAAAPEDVQGLFAGPSGDGGAFGAMATLLNRYTQTGGLIASARDRITEQVRNMVSKLDSMQARLEIRRATLAREYQAADAAMTQLTSQGSSLDSLANQYRLF